MIERYIAPVLTFTVLLAGHLAIGSRLLSAPTPANVVAAAPAASNVVQLEPVIITGKRGSAS